MVNGGQKSMSFTLVGMETFGGRWRCTETVTCRHLLVDMGLNVIFLTLAVWAEGCSTLCVCVGVNKKCQNFGV